MLRLCRAEHTAGVPRYSSACSIVGGLITRGCADEVSMTIVSSGDCPAVYPLRAAGLPAIVSSSLTARTEAAKLRSLSLIAANLWGLALHIRSRTTSACQGGQFTPPPFAYGRGGP